MDGISFGSGANAAWQAEDRRQQEFEQFMNMATNDAMATCVHRDGYPSTEQLAKLVVDTHRQERAGRVPERLGDHAFDAIYDRLNSGQRGRFKDHFEYYSQSTHVTISYNPFTRQYLGATTADNADRGNPIDAGAHEPMSFASGMARLESPRTTEISRGDRTYSRGKAREMISMSDINEILRLGLLGVIPESSDVIVSSNSGIPVVLDKASDISRAYSAAISRLEQFMNTATSAAMANSVHRGGVNKGQVSTEQLAKLVADTYRQERAGRAPERLGDHAYHAIYGRLNSDQRWRFDRHFERFRNLDVTVSDNPFTSLYPGVTTAGDVNAQNIQSSRQRTRYPPESYSGAQSRQLETRGRSLVQEPRGPRVMQRSNSRRETSTAARSMRAELDTRSYAAHSTTHTPHRTLPYAFAPPGPFVPSYAAHGSSPGRPRDYDPHDSEDLYRDDRDRY